MSTPARKLKRFERIPADGRDTFAGWLAAEYRQGLSIRAVAARHGLSYGRAHVLLTEADVTFRPRGGNTRRPA